MADIPNFPAVKAPDYNNYGVGRRWPARRTEMEGNVVSVRPRAGRSRKTFRVGWSKLSDADYNSLLDFFDTWQGRAFNFTPPGESTPVLCVFSEDALEGVAVAPDSDGLARWRVSVQLHECTDSELLLNAGEEEVEP